MNGSFLAIIGPNTFVPICWMCKKANSSVTLKLRSRSGISALSLWDIILDIFYPVQEITTPEINLSKLRQIAKDRSCMIQEFLENVDHFASNMPKSIGRAILITYEDSEAVIRICIKRRSPNLCHVQRTHRVNLGWLFERKN